MTQQALGMIETFGLVAAIEAADIALKTAAVRLVGYEKVKSGRIMVAVSGEVAAVQASVSAGSTAAAKINTVFNQHVIPRPIDDIGLMVSLGNDSEPLEPGPFSPEPSGPGTGGPKSDRPMVDDSKKESHKKTVPKASAEAGKRAEKSEVNLDKMSVVQLRTLARNTEGITIQGRQITKANKDQLITEILKARKKN